MFKRMVRDYSSSQEMVAAIRSRWCRRRRSSTNADVSVERTAHPMTPPPLPPRLRRVRRDHCGQHRAREYVD